MGEESIGRRVDRRSRIVEAVVPRFANGTEHGIAHILEIAEAAVVPGDGRWLVAVVVLAGGLAAPGHNWDVAVGTED